jgi:predicted nucleotidyltransferase
MAEQTQKGGPSKTVRIWLKPKERLQKVIMEKSYQEKRTVTEAELVSEAVSALCKKEEKKLGI